MIISNINKTEKDDLVSLSVRVEYENHKRDPLNLVISIPKKYEYLLSNSYEAFLLGCFSAALKHKEQRIHIDGSLCPYLRDNITAAMRLQKSWWFSTDHKIPKITAEKFITYISEFKDRKAACFFSGGVDSLSTILLNKQYFDIDHPYRFKYAFLVYGMDIGNPNLRPRDDLFKNTLKQQLPLAKELEMELIPIWTNMRDVEPDANFYSQMHFGALLAGLSHAMSSSIFRCSIAGDHSLENYVFPWGSTPKLNYMYSSSYLNFKIETLHLDRTEKIGLIVKNAAALSSIRVCYHTDNVEGDNINCGKCEKCIRTKLALLAYGKLSICTAFPNDEIDHTVLYDVDMNENSISEYYNETLVDLLEKQGQFEYSEIIKMINGHPGFKYKRARFLLAVKKIFWYLRNKIST